MNITKIISKTFDSRLKQIDLYANQASEIQHRVLSRLTRQAAQTCLLYTSDAADEL